MLKKEYLIAIKRTKMQYLTYKNDGVYWQSDKKLAYRFATFRTASEYFIKMEDKYADYTTYIIREKYA